MLVITILGIHLPIFSYVAIYIPLLHRVNFHLHTIEVVSLRMAGAVTTSWEFLVWDSGEFVFISVTLLIRVSLLLTAGTKKANFDQQVYTFARLQFGKIVL